jgi:hypothetical protein
MDQNRIEAPKVDFEAPKKEGFTINDLQSFQNAIASAQLNQDEFIEVDAKVFNYYVRDGKSKYFTYGNPGVRVYLEGMREQVEEEESRTIL